MNILMLYPEFPDTFWSFKHALAFVNRKASLPPLGLLTVASLLPREWNIRLIDLNVDALKEADLAWADYAMISAMTVQRKTAHKLIDRCRQSGLKVIAGGPLFQAEHEQFPTVDHFILNEAECTLPPFLQDLARGTPQRIYTSSEFPDMAESPRPMWELLNRKRYWNMAIQFSRGCPFNCDFCNVTALFGHRCRTKTSAQIIDELDSLYALGWRGDVFFVDDNFIGKKAFLKKDLLPALIEWHKGKKGNQFFTEASINLADDDELLDLMTHAGFARVFIGIETTDEQCLSECSKEQNRNRDMVADVKHIQRAGIQVQGGFIVGFDHDSPSVFQRQIEFIQNSGIVTAMVGLLQAPPGTRLFDRMQKNKRIRCDASGDNADGTTNIIPLMGLETLTSGYHSILQHIYSPGPYYERVKTLLRTIRAPRIRGHFEWTYLLAIMRSVYLLGIRGHDRMLYWKFMLWTYLRRPRLLPDAVVFSIYGYHFRQVLKLHVAKQHSG
jgi:radical SAM superfamily enzyme YgiQ (UPF0313 family)